MSGISREQAYKTLRPLLRKFLADIRAEEVERLEIMTNVGLAVTSEERGAIPLRIELLDELPDRMEETFRSEEETRAAQELEQKAELKKQADYAVERQKTLDTQNLIAVVEAERLRERQLVNVIRSQR